MAKMYTLQSFDGTRWRDYSSGDGRINWMMQFITDKNATLAWRILDEEGRQIAQSSCLGMPDVKPEKQERFWVVLADQAHIGAIMSKEEAKEEARKRSKETGGVRYVVCEAVWATGFTEHDIK